MKIGFFGGSFNPPTNAHISLAKKVLDKCNLNKLIFVPVGDFYKKNELLNFKHRYEMLNRICFSCDNIEVSNIEENKEKLYAIDVFELIKEKYPNDEIYYIMGSDNFSKICTWKNSKDLINKYKYIILERNNNEFQKIIDKNIIIKENSNNFIVIQEYIDISSSIVRNKIRNGEDVSTLIPIEVLKYIEKENLYM